MISLDKFIDEYARNVKGFNQKKTINKIEKHHSKVRGLIQTLREDINKELDSFSESIEEYADELRAKTNMREIISVSLGIPLEPDRIR